MDFYLGLRPGENQERPANDSIVRDFGQADDARFERQNWELWFHWTNSPRIVRPYSRRIRLIVDPGPVSHGIVPFNRVWPGAPPRKLSNTSQLFASV